MRLLGMVKRRRSTAGRWPELLGVETGMFYSASHNSPLNNTVVKNLGEARPKAIPTVQLANAFDGLHVIYQMVKATDGKRDGVKAIAAAKGQSGKAPEDGEDRSHLPRVHPERIHQRGRQGLVRRFINREIRTYEMQPDYGRTLNASSRSESARCQSHW